MTWRSAAWLLVAACALAGCAATAPNYYSGSSTPPPSYGPYDAVTNPYCGVTATCEPAITEPYAIPGYVAAGGT